MSTALTGTFLLSNLGYT